MQYGIAFTPLVGGMLIGAWLAGGRLPNASPGTLMVWGCAIAAAGMVILCGLRPDSPYFLVILPASVVFGAGRAIAYTPSMSLATHEIDPRDTGVASGLINASQQVGGAIGTALLNTIAAHPSLRLMGLCTHFASADDDEGTTPHSLSKSCSSSDCNDIPCHGSDRL